MSDTQKILEAITEAQEFNHAQHRKTRVLLREVLAQLERITTPIITRITVVVSGQSIHVANLEQESDMSYIVARDHADEAYSLDPITVSDSEGPVTKEFAETFESDNPDVVSIDTAASTLHFGTFGGANLTRKVTIDGQEFIVATAVFNVTPGALTVTGAGLTPDA